MILPGASHTVGGVVVTAGTVIVLLVALATVLSMGWVLSSTRVGTQVRAISDLPVVAELLGVPLFARTALVWGVHRIGVGGRDDRGGLQPAGELF